MSALRQFFSDGSRLLSFDAHSILTQLERLLPLVERQRTLTFRDAYVVLVRGVAKYPHEAHGRVVQSEDSEGDGESNRNDHGESVPSETRVYIANLEREAWVHGESKMAITNGRLDGSRDAHGAKEFVCALRVRKDSESSPSIATTHELIEHVRSLSDEGAGTELPRCFESCLKCSKDFYTGDAFSGRQKGSLQARGRVDAVGKASAPSMPLENPTGADAATNDQSKSGDPFDDQNEGPMAPGVSPKLLQAEDPDDVEEPIEVEEVDPFEYEGFVPLGHTRKSAEQPARNPRPKRAAWAQWFLGQSSTPNGRNSTRESSNTLGKMTEEKARRASSGEPSPRNVTSSEASLQRPLEPTDTASSQTASAPHGPNYQESVQRPLQRIDKASIQTPSATQPVHRKSAEVVTERVLPFFISPNPATDVGIMSHGNDLLISPTVVRGAASSSLDPAQEFIPAWREGSMGEAGRQPSLNYRPRDGMRPDIRRTATARQSTGQRPFAASWADAY
eukprot:scaffold795_cov375-Prasinococcus_capsulatus_cf.AAC.10